MTTIHKRLQRNPAIKFCASLKITLTCLTLLFILTFWGTIDQVYNGLYLSQERFFHSFFFTFAGFIPFPGTQLVLWVLFINLICVALVRFVYAWDHLGITIIHAGLLLFFVAAYITFHNTKESQLTLMEKEGSNVSSAYHDWEVALWKEDGGVKDVYAYDTRGLRSGEKLDFSDYDLELTVNHYYPHSEAYSGGTGGILNASGIQALQPAPRQQAPEKNFPGLVATLAGLGPVLLYGGEDKPLKITHQSQDYFLQLRRKHSPMPFLLRLKDFKVEWHPHTQVARSYQSLVDVIVPDGSLQGPLGPFRLSGSREVLISMNKPLRYKDFTLYQASYAIDQWGRESSTLAVVKNSGRLLPYLASFTTVIGLVLHFLLMVFKAKLKH